MTPETLQKLEEGARYALTDIELCLYAWISTSTYYDYKQKNPKFSDRIEELKESPSLKAKLNIVNEINKWDKDESRRWLERKNKKEFSKQDNIELTGKDGWAIATIIELPKKRDD